MAFNHHAIICSTILTTRLSVINLCAGECVTCCHEPATDVREVCHSSSLGVQLRSHIDCILTPELARRERH